MSENSIWTATTSTKWISFCPVTDWSRRENICSATTGSPSDSATSAITIYTENATKPDDASDGFITITSENSTIVKKVERCVPKVLSTSCEITFNLNINNSQTWTGNTEGTINVGQCNNGASGTANDGLKIGDIVLHKTQELDNGTTLDTTTSLNQSDVDILYEYTGTTIDGGITSRTSTFLESNKEKDRDVTLRIEKGSCSGEATLRQTGLMDDNGEYKASAFSESGYVSTTIEYKDVGFSGNCADSASTACTSDDVQFYLSGFTVTRYGRISGRTYCGDIVYFGGQDEPTETALTKSFSENDVWFSVPQEYGEFHGNTLLYYENTRNTDRVLNISAKTKSDLTYLASTTFTVISGEECKSGIYIHITSSLPYIPFSGRVTTTIKYWLSYNETPSEDDAITDPDILSDFSIGPCPISNCSTPVLNRNTGVYSRNVGFGQNAKNPLNGVWWDFTATYDGEEKTLSLYQASYYEQHVIPYSDYFVFTYTWDTPNVYDINMVSRISNCPNLTYADTSDNISGYTVGYAGGTSDWSLGLGSHQHGIRVYSGTPNSNYDESTYTTYIECGDWGVLNTYCTGQKSQIVCMKNISADTNPDDMIYVDMYASWMSSGKGAIKVQYDQYNSTGDAYKNFTNEMQTGRTTEMCDSNLTTKVTYNIKNNNARYITGGTVPLNSPIQVNAYGANNEVIVKSVECIDDVYTHVARLQYNKKANLMSLFYNFNLAEQPGLDSSSNSIKYYYYMEINNVYDFYEETIAHGAVFVGESGANIEWDGFYVKQTYKNHDYYLFPLNNEGEEIIFAVETRNDNSWSRIEYFTYTKDNLGTVVESLGNGIVTNLKVSKGAYSDKTGYSGKYTINIEFKMSETTSNNQRRLVIDFKKIKGKANTIIPCEAIYNILDIDVYQNYRQYTPAGARGEGDNVKISEWELMSGPNDWECVNGKKIQKQRLKISNDGGRTWAYPGDTGLSSVQIGTCTGGTVVQPDNVKFEATYIGYPSEIVGCNGNETLNDVSEGRYGEYNTEFAGGDYPKFISYVREVNIGFSGTSTGREPQISNCVKRIGTRAFQGCNNIINVCGYNDEGYEGAVKIPPSVETIGFAAFDFYTNSMVHNTMGTYFNGPYLKNVILSGTNIQTIENSAFAGCEASKIVLSNSVKSIGEYAFSGSLKIKSIGGFGSGSDFELSSSLEGISDRVFIGCTGLTAITLPENITYIGRQAFEDCVGLTHITASNIPKVSSIGYLAFGGCTGLTTVELPSCISMISGSFKGCTNLTRVTIPEPDYSIGIGESTFRECISLSEISIPKGLSSIGPYAFKDCTGLTSVQLPNIINSRGVTFRYTIYEDAFKGCTGLESVTIDSETPPGLENGAFDDTNNCPIYVPSEAIAEIYKTASGWSTYASRIQAIP